MVLCFCFFLIGYKIWTELGGESKLEFHLSGSVTDIECKQNKDTQVFTYKDEGDMKNPGTFSGALKKSNAKMFLNNSVLMFTIKNTTEENDGVYDCLIDFFTESSSLETYSK